MRKVFAILIFLVLAVDVFAGNSMSLRFKSVVEDGRISISAANEASKGGLFVLSTDGLTDTDSNNHSEKILMSDYDISKHDVEITFTVLQTQKVQTLG